MTVYCPKGADVYVYDFELEGRRYKATTGRRVKREAQAVEEAKRKELLDQRQLGGRNEITLEAAVNRYLKLTTKAADNDKNIGRARKLFGTSFNKSTSEWAPNGRFGLDRNMLVHQLQTHHVSELVEARLSEGSAERTINLELALLQRTVNLCRDRWNVRVNPNLTFEGQKFKVAGKERYLSPEEEARLLAALDPEADQPGYPPRNARSPKMWRALQDRYDFVVTLLDTGLRFNEASVLMWTSGEVSLNEGFILPAERAKGGENAKVGITHRLRVILTRRNNDRAGLYVFPNPDGDGPRPYHTMRSIQSVMDRLGFNDSAKVEKLGKATPHSFRDTNASRLVQAGYPILKMKDRLGHKTLSQT
jgi:integrase